MTPIPKAIIEVGIVLLLVFAFWYFLIRPAPQKTALGKVVGKEFQAAHSATQYRATSWRSVFQLQSGPAKTTIQIPDRYILTVQFNDGGQRQAIYMVSRTRGEKIAIGQELTIIYTNWYIPFAGRNFTILSIQ